MAQGRRWDLAKERARLADARLERDYELADDSSAETWLLREWDQRLTDEGMPPDIAAIPRSHVGLKRARKFCDNSELAERELSKSWSDQVVNRRRQIIDHLEVCRQIDTAGLTAEQQTVWAFYLEGVGERRLARHMGITRYRLWETWLKPIRVRLGLPVRPDRAEYLVRMRSKRG